jgi:hypothetical protein
LTFSLFVFAFFFYEMFVPLSAFLLFICSLILQVAPDMHVHVFYVTFRFWNSNYNYIRFWWSEHFWTASWFLVWNCTCQVQPVGLQTRGSPGLVSLFWLFIQCLDIPNVNQCPVGQSTFGQPAGSLFGTAPAAAPAFGTTVESPFQLNKPPTSKKKR